MEQVKNREAFGTVGQVKVFASSGALVSEIVESRSGNLTLMIDGAVALEPRSYSWGTKIQFQLTDGELPLWGGIVTNRVDTVKFKYHGKDKQKTLEVRCNDKAPGLMVVVRDGVQTIAVPVSTEDRFWLALQYLSLMSERAPAVDSLALMSLHRDLVAPGKT